MGTKMSLGQDERVLIYGIPAVTLLVWTASTLDPVNLPKMLLLVVMAFSILPRIAAELKGQKFSQFPIFVIFNLMLIIWVILSTVTSNTNPTQSFFGVSGRFTGGLTYISFSLIAIATFYLSTKHLNHKILAGLIISGIINLIYCGFVIFSNTDPIPWTNTYGNILGTFGNPNFISSFLGIFNIVLFAKLFDQNSSKWMIVVSSILILVSILEIVDSQSRQGLIVTALGCGAVVIYRLFVSSLNRIVKISGLLLYLLVGVLSFLAMLQIGPLTSYIYKLSVSIRGAYWRAGWETMMQNPIFGAGPDSFGDWYARVRDARAMVVPGPDVFTNSPHNVFIEQGANGGIPLFILYLGTQLFILSCGLRYLKNSKNFNYIFAASFFGWLGFTAQSLISINQIGLAVWGYVLGAMIVAIYVQSRMVDKEFQSRMKATKVQKSEFRNILGFGGAILGFILAIPPFYAEASWRSALAGKNLEQIVSAADQWPQSTDRYIQVSKALYENKFNQESLEFVRKGLSFNPNNARLWYFLYQLPGSTMAEKETAKAKLKVLDPNFIVK
jgi:O-antigen ligase